MGLLNIRRNIINNMPSCEVITGSNSTINFETNYVAPLKSLKIYINPIQDLHGYDKLWPKGGGINVWNEEWEIGLLDTKTGLDDPWPRTIRTKGFVSVKPNTTYYAYPGDNDYDMWACFYDENQSVITSNLPSCNGSASNARNIKNCAFTTPSNCYWIRFYRPSAYGTIYNYDMSINYPATVTTYSPYSNICPISGWTGANVQRTGANLFDKSKVVAGYIDDADGVLKSITSGNTNSSDYIRVEGGESYYIKTEQTSGGWGAWYDKNNNFISGITGYVSKPNGYVVNAPNNAAFCRVTVRYSSSGNIDTFLFNYPSTNTEYEPYTDTTYPVSWESTLGTVYGGTLDVITGELIVNKTSVIYDGSLDEDWKKHGIGSASAYAMRILIQGINFKTGSITAWSNYLESIEDNKTWGNYNSFISVSDNNTIITGIKSITTVEDWKTYLSENPLQIVYELATPITYYLNPIKIKTILGQNNFWADTGNIAEIKYLKMK